MSIDDAKNKMMTAPVAKKGFHFASDGIHFAEFVEAETIEEAEALYNKVKCVMSPAASPAIPQSTTPEEIAEETNG